MFFSTSPLPFCRQLINTKQSGDIEVAIIGSIAENIGKAIGKKKKRKAPPKKFDAMTEGRKVSQAKKQIEAKKKKEKKFSDIGKSMVALLQTGDIKGPGAGSIRKPGKMGGGKIYASMDKKYGGGIFPRKGNM